MYRVLVGLLLVVADGLVDETEGAGVGLLLLLVTRALFGVISEAPATIEASNLLVSRANLLFIDLGLS